MSQPRESDNERCPTCGRPRYVDPNYCSNGWHHARPRQDFTVTGPGVADLTPEDDALLSDIIERAVDKLRAQKEATDA